MQDKKYLYYAQKSIAVRPKPKPILSKAMWTLFILMTAGLCLLAIFGGE